MWRARTQGPAFSTECEPQSRDPPPALSAPGPAQASPKPRPNPAQTRPQPALPAPPQGPAPNHVRAPPRHHLDSAGPRGRRERNRSDSPELRVAGMCRAGCARQATGRWGWTGGQRGPRAVTRSQPPPSISASLQASTPPLPLEEPWASSGLDFPRAQFPPPTFLGARLPRSPLACRGLAYLLVRFVSSGKRFSTGCSSN